VYIDVGNVAELKSLTTEPNLILGGNVSLTEAMDTFYRISEENASYKYTKALGDHIDLIANVPVRNVSTPLRYAALLLKISVCLDVTLCSEKTVTNIFEECFCDTWVRFAQTAWHLIPEYVNVCTHCCEIPTPHIVDYWTVAVV
jgi:hypothetical protein